jgi:hypothetical protein
MNNHFKTNSRFDILNEEQKEPKKEVVSLRGTPTPIVKKREEMKTTEIKPNGFSKIYSIKLDDLSSFPDLIVVNKKEQKTNLSEEKISFTDIVQIEKKEEEEDLEKLPEGWIVLKKGKRYKPLPKEEKPIDPNVVFNKLVDSYEKWKAEYIENWGIEEYEREYRFPNYVYDSFHEWDSEDECEFWEQSNHEYE